MNFSQLRKSETRLTDAGIEIPTSPNFNPVEARAIAVIVVALVFGLVDARDGAASTGSAWNDQPAWTAPAESSLPSKKRIENRYRDTSPFAPGSHNFAFDVGQVFLMGDLGNKYDDSIGGQLHYTYGVSDLFGFDVSAGYSGHSDGDFSMTTLLAGLRTNLSWYDKVIPYLVFGLGFYRPSYTQHHLASVPGGDPTTTTLAPVLFGVHLGPGVDLELSRQFYFGASLTFHDVFGSTKNSQTGLAQDVGGTYASFLLHVGTTF